MKIGKFVHVRLQTPNPLLPGELSNDWPLPKRLHQAAPCQLQLQFRFLPHSAANLINKGKLFL